MKLLPIIVAGITLVAVVVHLVSDPELEAGSLPTDRISYPQGQPTGIVMLLSDAAGWSETENAAAASMVARGAIVVGVDLPEYYAALDAERDDCLYLVSSIEDLSRQLHRTAGIEDYHPPVVAGIGAGAALALAIAAQTPDATIGETLAIDPLAAIPLNTILCTPAEKTPAPGGTTYGLTDGDLPNPVRIVFTPAADAAGRAHAQGLKQGHPTIELGEAAGAAETVLVADTAATLDRLDHSRSPLDLPIVPIEVVPKHDTMAIIYSGDGGWRDIDQQLGAYMKAEGIPVVGVDALRYFWSEKTPEQTASDLSRIIATYRKRWKVENVILVGYSFGANILPATYRLLPEADRQVVSLVSLLALSHHADFEIDVTGWLGWAGAGKYGDPVNDLRAIEPHKIQCIYGIAEEDSACPAVRDIPGAEILSREGGHHFDGDYKALNDLIVERADALRAVN